MKSTELFSKIASLLLIALILNSTILYAPVVAAASDTEGRFSSASPGLTYLTADHVNPPSEINDLMTGGTVKTQSTSTSLDTISPVIDSVTLYPANTTANSIINMSVNASDNIGVVEVTANGTILTNSSGLWQGNITAASSIGTYPVLVRVKDAAGNFVNRTVNYSVVNRLGGIAVTSTPKPLSISGGTSGVLNVKLISTANIDDSVNLMINTNGITSASAANLTWFNRTSVLVQVPKGKTVIVSFQVTVPAGTTTGYKTFKNNAKSLGFNATSVDTGMVNILATTVNLVSIAVTPVNPAIALGDTLQFTALGTYSDGSTKNITSTATWSSGNNVAATIAASGLATSVAEGNTNITAAVGGITSPAQKLTVNAASLVSIAVTPVNPKIAVGENLQFTATGTYSDGSTKDITSTTTWSSNNHSAATIAASGLATSVAQGNSNITASMGGITSPAQKLTVNAASLVSIAVTPVNPTIALGETLQFTATGTYSDSSTKDITSTAIWSSSNTATATIAAGLATSKAAGTTDITASSGGITSLAQTLTVTAAKLVSIAVTPVNPTINLGQIQQFIANGTYSDGSIKNITATAIWSSNNMSVATINAAGLATSLALGITKVNATSAGISSPAQTLTVTSAKLVSIAVTPVNPTINLGQIQQFIANGTYSDGNIKNITATAIWSSNNTSVATINAAGLATSVAPGITKVNATSDGISSPAQILTVTSAKLVSIAVTPENPTIALGQTQQFKANGTYSDGSIKNITASATWVSSNTSVATIDSSGSAASAAVGTTQINATSDGISSPSQILTVTSAKLLSIAVTPENPTIALGQTQQFIANGTYSDGSIKNITARATWASSNTSVATIDSSGSATSAAAGTTQINASSEGITSPVQTLTVTVAVVSVSPPKITSFTPPSQVSNDQGEARIFNITVNQTVKVIWYINGIEVFNQTDVTESIYTNTSAASGTWNVNATALNSNGSDSKEWLWSVTSSELPPDPVNVAPPLDTTVATSISTATEFLYTGSDPIQTGVEPGTIEARRAAVLRGRVLTREETPLSGVNITILSHPEFGSTLTRADGMFDMAVNGGGLLTVNYEKAGYLSAQRQVQTPWQDYEWLPYVVMIQVDTQVTPIDLSSTEAFQVARGSVVADSDGTRQVTLMFPRGIQAIMTLPDGTTQPLSGGIHVRATEYTVGENGPSAMPAELPPTSGYTYAVEFSVDEAAGATDVRFDRPVYTYVENFLNFPVGGIVPVGYYDRTKAQDQCCQARWVPSDNGRIIKILSVTDGLADLDLDGSRQAANASQLAALNLTDAERQELATLYQPEQSLWRVPITHFTPWDFNWPYGPPPDAKPPDQPDPNDNDIDDPDKQCGSIIGCQNQVLGEAVDIVGTPFRLHYQSDRVVPGRKVANTLKIHLSSTSVPDSLEGINLEVFVAGRSFIYSFPALPNQVQTFTWDGKDAYGRIIQGEQPITIRLGYVYPGVYQTPAQFANSFSALSGIPISGDRARQNFTLWQVWKGSIGLLNNKNLGLGGWSLNVYNFYDPNGRLLYLGDGRKLSGQNNIKGIITTVAGNGLSSDSGDGGPATQAGIIPDSVAIGADGSLFISDTTHYRVRRVGPDGTITTVAGNGQWSFGGDGGPATQASLSPSGVAVGADGCLYIADANNHRVRRVGPDGIITTVAGNGIKSHSGDGGPATQASLGFPNRVAIGSDGSLYIVENENNFIRRVGPDGIITTVAGNGQWSFSGDGGPATQASINLPAGVAVGPDGSLYIADTGNFRIRRVGPDGIITTVAGNGIWGYSGDGGPATQAMIRPYSVDIGADGSLYISESSRVRRVGPDGIITTVAGSGFGGYSGDGGSATQAKIATWNGEVAIGSDGSLYIADKDNYRVRRVSLVMPGFSIDEMLIPSEDGSELYIFNSIGKHMRTLNALTGAQRYAFTYDSEGRLIAIIDGDGNVVTIERDVVGNAIGIISPYGQRTSLSMDANGYLAGITNPAGESTHLAYTSEGLLTSMTDGRGNTYHFSYDELGRLIKDEDPAGGFKALERTDMALSGQTGSSYSVKLSTGMGRNTTYNVVSLSTGDQRLVNTFPDGLSTETLIGTNGTQTVTSPDGTRTTQVLGPDPRFGMQAPVANDIKITSPGKLTQNIRVARMATLASSTYPLSLKTLTETTIINGKTFTRIFNATAKNVTSQTPLGRKTVTILDNKGRVMESQVPGIIPVQYTYDSGGRISSITQGTRNYAFSYDAEGNLASTTDPMLRTASFEYDPVGRVTRQTLPDGRHIQYSYDENGNVVSITPPGRSEHKFTYTPVDLIEEYLSPDVGVPNQTRYTYNIDRDLIRVTRPDGVTIYLGYDGAGRLNTITNPQGTTSLAYNSTTGKIKTITAPDGGIITYSYDGSLLTDTAWSGSVSGSVHRTYDNNFRITSENVNGANAVSFQYDLDGLLTKAGSLTLSRSPQNGMLTGTSLGNITDALSYNSFGEVAGYQAFSSATNIFSVQYTRDDLGRIIQKSETIDGAAHSYNYTYDLAGRLTEVWIDSIVLSRYTYDANGNRLNYTGSSGAFTGTYDDQDRLMQYGAATYTYTANGELLSKTNGSQTTSYYYDALGNLLNVTLPDGTQIEYIVDGQNRRIGKKVSGIMVQGFLYSDDLRPVAELDNVGNVVSRFVYAGGDNVPDFMIKNGATYRIITDHLGSPRFVVDVTTGAIMQQMSYDEFGNVIKDTNPGFQPFGFAGGLYDPDTNLVQFGKRDYDAETGRWTEKDPIQFAGGTTNLYEYVKNDPINFIDSKGLGNDLNAEPPYYYNEPIITTPPEPYITTPYPWNPNINDDLFVQMDLWLNILEAWKDPQLLKELQNLWLKKIKEKWPKGIWPEEECGNMNNNNMNNNAGTDNYDVFSSGGAKTGL